MSEDGEIIVSSNGSKWSAHYGGKHIVTGHCKPCVVNAIIKVTENSTRYKKITVLDKKGFPEQTIEIGAKSGE